MFKTIKNALKTPDVRKKLIYTLILIVVFRLGCYITVPGVDSVKLDELMSDSSASMAGLIDLISGGAFSNFSLFAMSITPYITSSIVIQLLGHACIHAPHPQHFALSVMPIIKNSFQTEYRYKTLVGCKRLYYSKYITIVYSNIC